MILSGHMVTITATDGDYTWTCRCGAVSEAAWHGDVVAATRNAVSDARGNGHQGGVAFVGFSMSYRQATAATCAVVIPPGQGCDGMPRTARACAYCGATGVERCTGVSAR